MNLQNVYENAKGTGITKILFKNEQSLRKKKKECDKCNLQVTSLKSAWKIDHLKRLCSYEGTWDRVT